jgi:hypothetical protein
VYADVIDYDPTLIQSCDSGKAGTLYSIIPSLSLLNRYSGAAAAYSLRSLSSSTTNVVKVRRDSDDSEQDFTASDITNGTLLSFVNADVEKIVNGDFATDTDWTKGTGWSISGGTANCDGTQTSNSEFKTTVGIAIQGVQVTFSFEVKNYSAGTLNATVEGTGALEFSGINANGVYSTTATSSDPLPKVTFTASSDFIGSIDNVSVIQSTANGFVTTWYDQSGNGNNATQATAASQPTIVSSGTLVTENGKAALDFDGTDDALIKSSFNITGTSAISSFSVGFGIETGANGLFSIQGVIGGADGYVQTTETAIRTGGGYAEFGLQSAIGSSLVSTFFPSGGDISDILCFINGSSSSRIALVDATIDLGANTTFSFGLGVSSSYFDGIVKEVILYSSDQSANRTGIEANINAHYNIYP